jgi:hypothetical protein
MLRSLLRLLLWALLRLRPLVSRLRYAADALSPEKAIARNRGELQAETGKDFIPYTFQVPVSLVIAKVGKDLALQDLVALDEEESRPHEIARRFWEGWRRYKRPRLVSFNGRGFDIPLLELCAFRYGIQIPDWFAEEARNFDQPSYRYNTQAHFDLHEWLTNSGASRFAGGLSLAATTRSPLRNPACSAGLLEKTRATMGVTAGMIWIWRRFFRPHPLRGWTSGSTSTTRSLPSRSKRIGITGAELTATFQATLSPMRPIPLIRFTGWPFTERILSPACSPALAAGPPSST